MQATVLSYSCEVLSASAYELGQVFGLQLSAPSWAPPSAGVGALQADALRLGGAAAPSQLMKPRAAVQQAISRLQLAVRRLLADSWGAYLQLRALKNPKLLQVHWQGILALMPLIFYAMWASS